MKRSGYENYSRVFLRFVEKRHKYGIKEYDQIAEITEKMENRRQSF